MTALDQLADRAEAIESAVSALWRDAATAMLAAPTADRLECALMELTRAQASMSDATRAFVDAWRADRGEVRT